MKKIFNEIQQINSSLRLLHFKLLEDVESINNEQLQELEYHLLHTADVANRIIEYANTINK